MKVGIIRYPGSNCDFDTIRYFENSFFIWHDQTDVSILDDVDLIVIPGGFAFGDRVYVKATDKYVVDPGEMALKSPVTQIIFEAVKRKIIVLGICNGFQILVKLKLLGGRLELNRSTNFVCNKLSCIANYIENGEEKIYETKLYIANSYGRYMCDPNDINKVKHFLHYNEDVRDEYNTNIAGVSNNDKTIFGMMPHPERNNTDFKMFLYKILFQTKPNIQKYLSTQTHFDNKITELMASEHISYKTTKRYLKTLHTKEPWVIQGPGENAGIVDIGDGYAIAIRIESHNHPTFIDPFEGAATGVGGILRDIFAMGARPIAIMDFLRFGIDGDSEHKLSDAIKGIAYYGNCVGVPNIGGNLCKSETYNKNPLVNVGCVGLVKKENIIYGNANNVGNLLIYVGSKTGNEGINGAAMASKEFTDTMNLNDMKTNVQKSDPFLEKLLLEACCELSEMKYIDGMQDMGAGGLLCASYELIHRGMEKTNINLGCKIDLSLVPTKYDMEPCNILISESQERMLIVADPSKKDEIYKVFNKWDLEYSLIGTVTDSGHYDICYGKQMLYSKKISEMAQRNNINDYTHLNSSIKYDNLNDSISLTNKKIKSIESDYKKIREKHYASGMAFKKSTSWSMYDSTVGNRTIKGPDKRGKYAILDIHEVNKQLFFTWGHTFKDCHEKMKRFIGVKPLCIVNCLNFGHPKDSLTDLSNVIYELSENCKKYNIPVVGGNVSLYNSTGDISIKPTPILLMMGISN